MLDALNDDCRRLVLSYVPVRDIMRAERVSRSWQREVLQYLRSVRIIISSHYPYEKTIGKKSRILLLNLNEEWFNKVTTKLGSSIVASYCFNERTLLTLLQNCPNLEQLVSAGLHQNHRQNALSFTEEEKDFIFNIKKPKQITFKYFMDIDDDCIREFIENDLNEFTIELNEIVTGNCLLSLPSNLKGLSLIRCSNLKLQHLLLTLKTLPNLRKLELNELDREIFESAHLLLDEVPNLEELILNFDCLDTDLFLNEDIPQSISRLSHLKRLNLSETMVYDKWLVAIGRGCRQLQEVNLARCPAVTPCGVVMMCKSVGTALTALNMDFIYGTTDKHVLDIIGSCPNLKSLDVFFCQWVDTINFTASAAQLCAARAQPLSLRCKYLSERIPNKRVKMDVFPGLIIDFDYPDTDCSDDSSDDCGIFWSDSDMEFLYYFD